MALLVWAIMHVLKVSQLNGKNKVVFIAIGIFSLFGLLIAGVITSTIVSSKDIKPRMGHYLTSTFSDDKYNTGEITLTQDANGFEVFPKNKDTKLVNVYKDGQMVTGELINGRVNILQGEQATNLTLPWVFFGQQ